MRRPSLQRGVILLFTLVISAILMTVTASFFNYLGSAVRAQDVSVASAQARMLAEAGIDEATYSLNQDSNYAGETDTALGPGTFTVTVTSINSTTKRISVTGYVPDSAAPVAQKTVAATVSVNTSVVSFRFGVQVGSGGVYMHSGSYVYGDIFSDGSIGGSGTITGDATVAMGAQGTVDQQSTVQTSDMAIGDASADAVVAQSFTPATSGVLAKVSLYLKKIGTPGDLAIYVVPDSGGAPSSNTVLTNGVIQTSSLASAYGFVDASLNNAPILTAGQTYWIVAVGNVDASNYVDWGLDSSGGYAGGSAARTSTFSAGTTWTALTGDLDFKTYTSNTTTSLDGVAVQGNAWAYSLANCSVGGSASYETISGCSVAGTSTPDTAPAAAQNLPISNSQISDWESLASSGSTLTGPYTISGTQTLGPAKINGDLTLSNGSELILSGPVWVNGNIYFSNNATLSIAPSTGSSGAILIADETGNTTSGGVVHFSNNVNIGGNGSGTSYPMIVSTNTSNAAVELSNNSASVIIYAPYGGVQVSNGANANQITAKYIELENQATVTYKSGLQTASFSNGPGGSWGVVPGTYAIVP